MTNIPVTHDLDEPVEQQPAWMLIVLLAVAVGLFVIIVWLWFRCSDEPTVDWLLEGARQIPGRVRP